MPSNTNGATWIAAVIAASWVGTAFGAMEDAANLLRAGQIDLLETHFANIQRDFENGVIDEFELRESYRPLYEIDERQLANLQRWLQTVPGSYAANLTMGIHLKRAGLTIRGTNYAAATPAERLDAMRRYLENAESLLTPSLELTDKPYLSLFHLLDISMQLGQHEKAKAWIARANRILPDNALARGRYLVSLLPRWGGSYEEVDAFIESAAAEGAPAEIVALLQAVKHEDIGTRHAERGDEVEARREFEEAGRFRTQAGDRYGAEFQSPCAAAYQPTCFRTQAR